MYYFIAHIEIHNKEEYQKYLDKADDVFKKYKGKYLAVDNLPKLLEGNFNYSRTVIIQFESKADFDDWYYSPDYQEILKHRLKGAVCDTILVHGLH